MVSAHGHAADHMDRIYRYQRHFYDLTRRPFLLGRDRLLKDLMPPRRGTVLEIGCGTARNLIHAASIYPHARFFGIDVSAAMLETARVAVDRAHLAERISLAQADAATFDCEGLFGEQSFDRLFISYALSMMPPWRDVLRNSLKRVRTGGSLHIVDFGQQERLPGWFRTVSFAWLRQFSVKPESELAHEVETLADTPGMDLRIARLYRGYAISVVLCRHKHI